MTTAVLVGEKMAGGLSLVDGLRQSTVDLVSMLVGGGPFVFTCPKCTFITLAAHRLRQHAITEHGGKLNYQLYVCSVCSVTSTEHDIIRHHVEAAHVGAVILAQNIRLKSIPVTSWQQLPPTTSTCDPSSSSTAGSTNGGSVASTGGAGGGTQRHPMTAMEAQCRSTPPSHNWAQLITRAEKKFVCLVCDLVYPGRTEAVFHTVIRHLLQNQIESDLCRLGGLTDETRSEIRQHFTEGMRIRSGVHYKNAEMVEAALFLSIELHLRQVSSGIIVCSQCRCQFHDVATGILHINEKLRGYLPEFMRSRSCPWSLHIREEWVWLVPDSPADLPPAPGPSHLPTPSTVGGGPQLLEGEGRQDYEQEEDQMEESLDGPEGLEEAEVGGLEVEDVEEEGMEVSPPGRWLDDEVEGPGEEHSVAAAASEEDQETAVMSPEELAAKEAMLEGGLYVIATGHSYHCSHCSTETFASERLTKEHIVEAHLEVQLAQCPHCEHQSDQRGMKAHCSRFHRHLAQRYIYNPAFHSLQQKIRVQRE